MQDLEAMLGQLGTFSQFRRPLGRASCREKARAQDSQSPQYPQYLHGVDLVLGYGGAVGGAVTQLSLLVPPPAARPVSLPRRPGKQVQGRGLGGCGGPGVCYRTSIYQPCGGPDCRQPSFDHSRQCLRRRPILESQKLCSDHRMRACPCYSDSNIRLHFLTVSHTHPITTPTPIGSHRLSPAAGLGYRTLPGQRRGT
ncbi:hypothetical protein BKA56DRAFT_735411 [Ilyonectria sp. MPI-CAGE-AT-0026]|nr:hypothetical protein BKA56DRAFT_735411 [Ilyonectria sp. MPI-CAGE-AT-0026]